jgi:hypothetical protein
MAQRSGSPGRQGVVVQPCPNCDGGIIRENGKRATANDGPEVWIIGECDRCNTFSVDIERPAPRPAPRAPVEWRGGFDKLRQVPSAYFVPALTDGREVVRGYVSCPLHDDDRPSLHVSDQDARWFCHGCGRGGGLPEFYCALYDRSVPTDRREFARLCSEIADVLGRAR